MKYILGLLMFLAFSACKESEKERVARLVDEWNGKSILLPNNLNFSVLGKDTVCCNISKRDYSIVVYTDSKGCISCKLKLKEWKGFINQLEKIEKVSVPILFFLHPKEKRELVYILRQDKFTYPVCFDYEDTFNKLNHFPEDMAFQTFLLDKDNKVVAIGNPVHNPKVKELYLKIIMGDKAPQKEVKIQTTAMCSNTSIDMGTFDWHQEQKSTFTLTNTGSSPLVITDVVTSCGCTTVDYGKEPVRPGSSVALKVNYKADHPEHFNKTITVYCNAATSPIQLKIKGKAE